MKILIVMNYNTKSGLVVAVNELIVSLQREGYTVETMSTCGGLTKRIRNILKILTASSSHDFIIASGAADYGFLPILVGIIASKIHKKRILVDFHEGYPVFFMGRLGRLIKLFLGNTPVTVASRYLFDIFNRYKFNVSLIPYHFHYEGFPKGEKAFGWNRKIIWVGTFQHMYDPETALQACEIVLQKRDDIEFTFFGNGPLLSRLTRRYNHPNIIFKGFIPRDALLKEYQQYCIFLNTSFGDNFPLRLVEAAFNKLLVISARWGGTATIYGDKECLFFERGNYKELSKYILDVIDNPHLYDSFRENMHNKIMNFTWGNARQKWLSLIKENT